MVLAEVRNHGEIPSDLLPEIFQPFRQGDGTGKSVGVGLGSFIAQAIARAHHGDVEVEATAERGTCFRVALPRSQAVRAAG